MTAPRDVSRDVSRDVWEFDGFMSLGSPFLVRRLQTFFGIHFLDSVDETVNKEASHSGGQENVNDRKNVKDRTYHLRSRKVETTSLRNSTDSPARQNGLLPAASGDSNASTAKFVIESKFFHYLFLFGAALGNELFTCFLWSTLLWHVDAHVCRITVMVWCLTIYLGQVLKELVKWPRPSSPPAAYLETRYQLEYGMPSTHAVVGVTVPYTLLYMLVQRLNVGNNWLGWLTCTSWCLLTCASRTYLGMHSVLDVLAGMLFGLVLFVPGLQAAHFLDEVIILHPYGGQFAVLGALTLCFLYPKLNSWNTARADSYMVCAVALGIYLSCRYTHVLDESTLNGLTSRVKIVNALLQTLVGAVLIAVTRLACKFSATRLLCSAFGLDSKCSESLQQKRFEMPYKFMVYVPMCVVAIVICPRVFTLCSIH